MGDGNIDIQIGQIDYTNAWPLFRQLDQYLQQESVRAKLRPLVPAELNRSLYNGELDISAVSSFAYASSPEQYWLLPSLSVGSIGAVKSILLFTKEPLGEASIERVAVTNTSATSIHLLQILLAKRYDCFPTFVSVKPNLSEMLEQADAALLIGDPAIYASWDREQLHVVDLGQLWYEWTGTGMTYAVVAVRRDSAKQKTKALLDTYKALLACRTANLYDLPKLAAEVQAVHGGSLSYWHSYFAGLQYDFNPLLQEGLRLYFQYAYELQLIEQQPELVFWPEALQPAGNHINECDR